jgi:hypothetical protein
MEFSGAELVIGSLNIAEKQLLCMTSGVHKQKKRFGVGLEWG